MTFCYYTATGTFRIRFDSTILDVSNGFINAPENSTALSGDVTCATGTFTTTIRDRYFLPPSGVDGWYFDGSRLDNRTQGISITDGVLPHLSEFIYGSRLTWPSVATRNLDGIYTCRVGSDSRVLEVHIQSECRGNATT